nr:MAG TPA: hypothetical protein [Caudoviricetes sp.]
MKKQVAASFVVLNFQCEEKEKILWNKQKF